MQPVKKIKKKDRIDIIIEYTNNISLTFLVSLRIIIFLTSKGAIYH